MRKRLLLIVGFLTLAGLIGAACTNRSTGGGGGGAVPGREPVGGGGGGGAAPLPAASPGGPFQPEVGKPGLSLVGPHIVKTATVSLELKKGSFTQQFQQASLIAGSHGGYVTDSQTSSGRSRSGTIVLRIPSSQFEVALGQLKGLGTVKSERIAGTDVTAQFVDLQARLRNWEAQEKVLLGLMAKATTIDASLKVQRELQDVQLQIEEIRGQLNVLNNQTDLSTITLTMAEAGFVPAKPQSTLAKAWHEAVHGFFAVIGAVVVGLGYLLPLTLLLLLGLAVYRGFRSRMPRRTPSPAAPPNPVG